MSMTSSKPYLIRAMYEWILDNGLTPYIAIDAFREGVQVPQEFVEDGRIVLNISPTACRGLHLENSHIVFSARFSGIPCQISTPPNAVMAIYAKENGRGMVFGPEDEDDGPDEPSHPTPGSSNVKNIGSKRPTLKVVK